MTDMDDIRDADAGEAIDFLRSLIVAQKSGENAVQQIVAERLSKAGCQIETLEYDPLEVPVRGDFAAEEARMHGSRRSLVGHLPGDPSLRSLLLFAHPDSEPVSGLDAWTADPFAGDIRDGRIHGWGVADDLAGVAAATLAVARAAASGCKLGTVSFASTPSKHHARGVAAVLHQGLAADAALYLHPAESGAGLNEIKAFASGHLEFRLTVHGRLPETTEPIQTAFAHLAVNPLDKAIVLHAALDTLARVRAGRISHPRLEEAVGQSTNLIVSTLNCSSGRSYGRLAESCVMGGAVSFPPGQALQEVMNEVEAAIARACESDDWLRDNPPEIEWVSGVTGAECPPDHPLYAVTARAVTSVTGSAPHVNPMHTSSDIRNPAVEKGIPTVALGGLCGDLSQNGRHDEWVDVADYFRTISATEAVIIDWCGERRAFGG